MKYIKKYTWAMVLVFLLLIVQAYCDLTLPEYTSKIVDVGIQQGGIAETSPDVIRESRMNELLLLTDEDEAILNGYALNSDEGIYERKTLSKEELSDLGKSMAKPMTLLSAFENPEMAEPAKEKLLASAPEEMKPALREMSLWEIISSMPEEQRFAMLSEADGQFGKLPENMLHQAAVTFIREEYSAIGIDVDGKQIMYIVVTGLKMLGLALIGVAITVVIGLFAARISAGMARDMRNDVFNKVVSFSNSEFDRYSTASLITRTTNDIQQVQMLMLMLVRMVFYAPIVGTGGIFKVLGTDSSMSWIIAVGVGAILTLVFVMFAFTMPKFKSMQKLVDRLNLVTREILTGLPVIRAFSTEKHEEKRFDEANRNLTKTNLFVNRVMSCMMPAMMFIMNGITVLIVWVGGNGINNGQIQVGDMMAFIQYTMQIVMAFLMISMVSVMLPRAAVSVNRINEVLDAVNAISDPEEPEEFSSEKTGFVEFRNVSFKYPNADEQVLENISFTAKPGEVTAFIGSTGSGKSTLVNLIPRMYDVTEGEILVDGTDIRKVSQKALRDKIGFVPQKGVLFSGTIRSNIAYGNPDISEEELRRAARIAQAEEFIESKPDKYETDISQGGSNVSGGQKQRLSIARAIAKNPEIYIFDDSFSALDYKTDIALRKALKEETGDSTVLIVAQRISTVLNADNILVLDEGKIVGMGTHCELLKNCEVYKQIALSQLSKEELENE